MLLILITNIHRAKKLIIKSLSATDRTHREWFAHIVTRSVLILDTPPLEHHQTRDVSMCSSVDDCSMRENSFECIPRTDKNFSSKKGKFSFTIIGKIPIEGVKSENFLVKEPSSEILNLLWQGAPKIPKMLVPPHMIEEQSKIIYQINKYYVERVQTRTSIIDKTIREICQIIQDILRVSPKLKNFAHFGELQF